MAARLCRAAGALAVAGLLLGAAPAPAARQAPAPGTRIALGAGLAGIDRGLRQEDVPLTPLPALAAASRQGDGLPYEPGRVIVKLRPGLDAAALAAVARSVDAIPRAALPYADFDLLMFARDRNPETIARALNAHPDVAYAQAAYRAGFHFTPNDPLYRMQWHLRAIDMERVWDITRGASPPVVVAVIDSGVAFENVVLRYHAPPITAVFADGRRASIEHGVVDVPFAAAMDLGTVDRFHAPFDFVWNDAHPVDTLGHGTHVAGTIGQLTDNGAGGAGMASNVRIMPVKVAAGGTWDVLFGAPSPAFTDDQVARAIRYAADNGARAINMSFGRAGPEAPVVEDAVRYAVSRGAFCVFSAGNGGQAGSPLERYAEIASRIDGAIAVGAVGPGLQRAPYSSVGPWVEISAPGGDTSGAGPAGGILQQTLDPSLFTSPLNRPRFDALIYQFSQGTSTAAAHVTGFAAILVQQGLATPAAIEAAMTRYATDRGAPGRDPEYGAGVINPRATLLGLR